MWEGVWTLSSLSLRLVIALAWWDLCCLCSPVLLDPLPPSDPETPRCSYFGTIFMWYSNCFLKYILCLQKTLPWECPLLTECMSHWAGQCEWCACNTCLLQMGVVMYSEDPKVRFLLNRHSNSETLLQDILTTPFNDRPGNNIGVFVFFVFSFHNFYNFMFV